jgi:centromere/kinetochore protein ZW10
MPSLISDHQYGQAVVESVYNGSYPESEEIISANLPESALPTILELVHQAQEGVKVCHKVLEDYRGLADHERCR